MKIPKTTKLGMEIDSDDDDEVSPDTTRDEQKIIKNGSFSSTTFLKSRNLFNLRLSTDVGSRLTFDSNLLPKKSPVTYSRQTSSSSSEQKSANSLQPSSDWEAGTPTPNGLHRQRRNSISSCYSISESSTANEMFTMNQSEF